MSTERADRPASTARRGSLPNEPEPVVDPALAGAPLTSSVFGDGEGDDPSSLQGRISRLDNIFAMLSILDSNDEVMLRRLETELMRLEAQDLQQDTTDLEHDYDQRIQLPTTQAVSPEQATSRGFYDVLYSLSELGAQAETDRHEDPVDPHHQHSHHQHLQHHHHHYHHGHPEEEESLQQLLLPNGTPMSSAHIDVVFHAVTNARHALNIDAPDVNRAPVDRVEEQVRRLSTTSEPDREQREGEGEQIEGYEGDRAETNESGQQRNEIDHAADERLSQIIETLKAFHANGTGVEEFDDFVLQAVLQLHAGPSTDNTTSSPDHLGNEQMQLYQDCIAAIDDFFELLAMINDDADEHTDAEHRGTASADDDAIEDDEIFDDEPEIFRSRSFSRGSS